MVARYIEQLYGFAGKLNHLLYSRVLRFLPRRLAPWSFWQEHNISPNNMAALMRAVEAAYPTTRQTLRQVLYPHQ